MRWRLALATLGLVLLATGALAQETTAKGVVRNRDGEPLSRCLVEFRSPGEPDTSYSYTTSTEGGFFVSVPRPGQYSVKVECGSNGKEFPGVVVGAYGLENPTLVVDW